MLGIVGHCHKGHIHQHLRHQPPGLHREVAQYQRTQHTERVAQHVRCVQRRDLQYVNDQLHQQQLHDQRHIVFVLYQKETQVLVQRIRVLHQQVPQRCDEHGQQQHQRPYDLQIRADEGWEVVVVDLLVEPQDRCGQQQGRR